MTNTVKLVHSTKPRWLQTLGHLDKLPEVWRCCLRFKNWPTVIYHFLDLPRAAYPVDVRTRSGLSVTLEEFCDVLSVWEMYCRDQYRVPANARTIVDIGANIGIFTIWAAHRAPASQIFSFEPFPRTFERLIKNVETHGLSSRVVCRQAAIAANSGSRSMSAEPLASSARSLLPTESPATGPIVTVPTLTLAEILAIACDTAGVRRIDVLKMDVEGAEHEVLPNIDPDILSCVHLVEVEYHPSASKLPLFAALERAGFNCIHDSVAGENLGVAHFRTADTNA